MKSTIVPVRRFSRLVLRLRQFGSAFGLLVSVMLAGGAVAGSFLVPTKALGVFLAASGCFAAGWLFAVFFARSLKLVEREESANADLKAALDSRTAEVAGLRDEVSSLRQERDRLRGQRIDVNAVRPILKLGLAEAEMSIKDVKTCWSRDFDTGSWVSSPTRSRYVGVLQRSFKAAYGVDLQKVRVSEDGDTLRIAGIAPESLGLKNDRTDWLIRQIQTFPLKKTSLVRGGPIPAADPETGFPAGDDYYEIDRDKPFAGSLDLNRTQAESTMQERELGDRIDKGIGAEFQNINVYIRDMAQGFLQYLFAPVGKRIVFVSTPLSEIENDRRWLAIEDYAKDWNKRLDAGYRLLPSQDPTTNPETK